MSNFQNLVVEKVVEAEVKMEDLVGDLVEKESPARLVEMVAATEVEAINQMVVVAETVVHQVGQTDIQPQIRVQAVAAMMEGVVTVVAMVAVKEVEKAVGLAVETAVAMAVMGAMRVEMTEVQN